MDNRIAFMIAIGFGGGMKLVAPSTYIDDDGVLYFSVNRASRMIPGLSQKTLWAWAAKGVTSFGFQLDIKQQPMVHDPRGYKQAPRIRRQARMLVSEHQIAELTEILTQGRVQSSGGMLHADRDRLEVIAKSRKLKKISSSTLHI
jgi:hypothetical protein